DLVSGPAPGNNGASATVGIKDAGTQGANRLLLAFNNGPNAFVGTGKSTSIALPTTDDWYTINVTDTNTLNLATATPAGGRHEFVTPLVPGIELSDPTGARVPTGIGNYDPPTTGLYRVHVTGRNGSRGEYVLGTNFTPLVRNLAVAP